MNHFQNPSVIFEEIITPDGFRFKRRKTPKLENELQKSKERENELKSTESTNQTKSELNLKRIDPKNNDLKSMFKNEEQHQTQLGKELKLKSDDLRNYNMFESNIEKRDVLLSQEEIGKENIPRNIKEGMRREPILEEIRQDAWKREMKPFSDPIREKERRVINLKESLEKLDKVLKMESEIGSKSGGRGLSKYPKLEKGEYLKNLERLREINPEIRSGELFKQALKFENDRTGGLFKEWNVYSQTSIVIK